MSSGAKKSSAALSLIIPHNEKVSHLQFEGNLSSFHAANLIHNQFLLMIVTGNILSDLRTSITVIWSDYDLHWLNKLPRILINVDIACNPRQLNCKISSWVCQALILMRRSESIFPVKIFERSWL